MITVNVLTRKEFAEGYWRASGITEETYQQICQDEGMTREEAEQAINQTCTERYNAYVDQQVQQIRSIQEVV